MKYLSLLLTIGIVSCGNSTTPNEKTKEQIIQETADSVNRVRNVEQVKQKTIEEQNQRNKQLQIQAKKDAEIRENDLISAKSQLSSLEAELIIQNDKLDNIKARNFLELKMKEKIS